MPLNGFARPELLASTDWLAEQLGQPQVRIIDVRWRPDGTGRDVFSAGHVPNAVHVDWRRDLIADTSELSSALLLAPPDRIAAAMSAAGVGDGTTSVIYDDTLSLYAARTWWSLLAYGFESVRLLDGGWTAWSGERRPISNAVLPHAQATFTPRANSRIRVTTADIRALLGSTDTLILDARAPAEYRGLEGNARRLGHIPGAINVPVGAMRREGSQHIRDAEGIREMLVKANVPKGRRMICYDGSGVAAAKLAFVLMLMGYDDVAVYDGGWAEWGDRLDLPVDR
jgi:thiosulfate/3-mercaptopyruvate sulfurtransferase